MLDFLTLKPEAFGLDISDLSLKAVKLSKKGKFLGLSCFGEISLKPDVIVEGEVNNEVDFIKAIKKLLSSIKGGRLKTRYVVVSLPEQKAFLKVIQMPKMRQEDLNQAVYFEAENHIPLPIEKVYFDSQIVLPLSDHLDHLDVLIAALPREIIDPHVACLKGAGLIPIALEIESQAVVRALIKGNVSPCPVLLVDLGATETRLVMFAGHCLHFTTSFAISGNKFNEAISAALRVSLKQAEKLKTRYGLERKSRGSNAQKVFEALEPDITELVEHIEKYMDYYQSHAAHQHLPANGKGVKKVYLCGGGANIKGLADLLRKRIKIPVELANPWVNILPSPLKQVPQMPYKESLRYVTALGLALRGINYD